MDFTPVVRQMTRDEAALTVNWAAREGWNPGLDDADAFWDADPGGFFLVQHDGEILGTISAVAYGERFGFVGFYIVKPGFRGRRIGPALADHALERLGSRSIGIDGILAKQRQYAKFYGFRFAYQNIRFGGQVTQARADSRLCPLREVPFAEVEAYDRRHFPAPRETFLRRWVNLPDGHGLGFREDNRLAGYGVIRRCRDGFKIGPLFADNPEIGESLFLNLCSHAAGSIVYLDVPDPNAAGCTMARRHGMKEVFATARMYRGDIPDLPVSEIFGVTTFELG